MSERILHRVGRPFGLVLTILLTLVCVFSLYTPAKTALGQDAPNGDVPEGLFSLIHEANVAGYLVSTIEKDLSVVDEHPGATSEERYALRNTLALVRVELLELEKSITETLSDYYNVDVSIITAVRNSGTSWGSIVAGLENGGPFDTPRTHDGIGGGGSVVDGRSEEPPTTLVMSDPTADVLGPTSPRGGEDDSWGYGLDRYAAGGGGNGNSRGGGSPGSGTGGVGGDEGGDGGSGNSNGNNGIGWGVGGSSNAGGNSSGNNGIGWGVGGSSNAGGNGNGNNGNNNGNNGVGGGAGGGRDGNRGRGNN
jgi:hypothetical protein